jgi:hypothetical protein
MHIQRHFAATVLALAGAGLLISPTLRAGSVGIAPVTIGAPLQTALHDRYGAESLGRALKSAGASLETAASLRIEVSIEQAVATHPTRRQLLVNPSLDYLRSIARGGAQLRAVLRDTQGRVIDRFEYDHYAPSLDQISLAGGTWGDALIAIDRFATQLASAWRHHWVS